MDVRAIAYVPGKGKDWHILQSWIISSHLATYLGEPQKQFKSIHVGGTNGKGSCSHMLASMSSGGRL